MFRPLPCVDPLEQPRIQDWQRGHTELFVCLERCSRCHAQGLRQRKRMVATSLLGEDREQESCYIPQGRGSGAGSWLRWVVSLGKPTWASHSPCVE